MNKPRSPPGKTVSRAFTGLVRKVAQALGWSIRKAGLGLHRLGSELELWAHERQSKGGNQ